MTRKANYTIDFRGGISSISLLKMTRIFKDMKPLEIMEILGSDTATRRDLFKVLPAASYEVAPLDVQEEEDSRRLRIRKLR
ncbi:MAG: hypothetical protein GY859_13965 [Desulfobacterales bacterium]|nr:hypothetical protein [Desulfobacterales bacterium]